MTDSSDEENKSPAAIQAKAKKAIEESLPSKSKAAYEIAYNKFIKWQKEQGTQSLNEAVLVAYFHDLGQTYKSSTLWSTYSMLRSMINNKHNINIYNYKRLMSFLKQKHVGYQAKKSKTLSSDEVETFLERAPDQEYLDVKVALIIGIYGACRGGELCNLTIDDVTDLGSIIQVKIPDTKTHLPRLFVIDSKYYDIIKKYMSYRPKHTATKRFFLNYRKGHCTNQVIGKNKIGTMPQKIAKYLNLDDPESYTGHSFRRSSATMLANAGADMISIKRHGGWKSDQVAEGYLDDSLGNKTKRAVQLTEQMSRSVPQNNNVELEDQSVKKQKVDNCDTSTPKASNPPQIIYNITINSVQTLNMTNLPKDE